MSPNEKIVCIETFFVCKHWESNNVEKNLTWLDVTHKPMLNSNTWSSNKAQDCQNHIWVQSTKTASKMQEDLYSHFQGSTVTTNMFQNLYILSYFKKMNNKLCFLKMSYITMFDRRMCCSIKQGYQFHVAWNLRAVDSICWVSTCSDL